MLLHSSSTGVRVRYRSRMHHVTVVGQASRAKSRDLAQGSLTVAREVARPLEATRDGNPRGALLIETSIYGLRARIL